jgi:hypothetical protein
MQHSKGLIISSSFLLFTFILIEGTLTSFLKDKKVIKKSQKSKNQGFSYYLCLIIEGSDSVSGSVVPSD